MQRLFRTIRLLQVFEIKRQLIFCLLFFCAVSCGDQNHSNSIEPFITDIDSNLFQQTELNEVRFLIPREMTPVDDNDHRCEFSVLHKEEHLIFTQTPCDQIFDKESNLKAYVDIFLEKNKNSSEHYKVQSIDSVIFRGKRAFVVCYRDKPWGFPSTTNNECFIFENANKFNVLHTWSIDDLNSSLMRKSKYTFVLDSE